MRSTLSAAMSQRLLIPTAIAGAVLLGFTGRQLVPCTANEQPDFPRSEISRPNGNAPAPAAARAVSHARSSETLASLIEITDWTLYGRLALWLLDADEAEIAAYWQHDRQLAPREPAIVQLLFIQWTRLNPQAALAAVAGTEDEATAWWAWACHDPAAALASAIADHPSRVGDVARGIGEFHPAWLRAHLADLPAAERGKAMMAMKRWNDDTAPLETLEFFRQHGSPYAPESLAALIRKDPWAAYDWVLENAATSRFSGADKLVGLFVKNLSDQHPEVLQRLAKQAPSGALKLKLETAVFDLLLASDPAAALAEAKACKVPRIATQRLAAIGNTLVKTDPEQAFAIARELFAANPAALTQHDRTLYGKGQSSGYRFMAPGLSDFLGGLMDSDPVRTMGLQNWIEKKPGSVVDNSGFSDLAAKWASRDLPEFGDWVNEQTDPAVRNAGAAVVIDQLRNKRQFAPALEWAARMQDARLTYLYSTFAVWQQTDQAAAVQWLDTADLHDNDKAYLRRAIRTKP